MLYITYHAIYKSVVCSGGVAEDRHLFI